MPIERAPYINLGPMINAWAAHYERIGCTRTKAMNVARKRVSRKRTWPPIREKNDG